MKRLYIMLVILAVTGILSGCSGGIMSDIPASYDSLIESGWEKYNQRRYNEAYQSFLKARKEDNARPESYLGTGWTLLRIQHPDSAIVVFRTGFYYITSLDDSVDALCGLSGSYLANGENTKVVDLFKKYPVSSYNDAFPIKEHDFFLDEGDLEIVQAMAFYRLGLYSSEQNEDPDNAVYHVNRILLTPIEYKDPKSLMDKMTEYLEGTKGDYYL